MMPYRKIVWVEGMLLSQQQFQAWDRQQAWQWQQHFLSHFPMGWGVVKLEIVEEALLNGLFHVRQCQVIFPNGSLVAFDEAHDGSLTYNLSTVAQETCDIYLCWPVDSRVSGISGYPSCPGPSAWEAEYRMLGDENAPERLREILLGRPCLSLRSGEISRHDVFSLKIAEVVRREGVSWQCAETFVPPVVHWQTSRFLRTQLQRLLLVLQAKQTELKQGWENHAIPHALALQKITEAKTALKRCDQSIATPPEQVYTLLVDLFCSLNLFSGIEEALPLYQHEALYVTFSGLFEKIHRMLSEEWGVRKTILKVIKAKKNLYLTESIDSTLLDTSSFYLVARLNAQESKDVDFIRGVKITAPHDIDHCVSFALPGLPIVSVTRLPRSCMMKPGFEYFALDHTAPLWAAIKESRAIAIFLSERFEDTPIEFWGVPQ